MIDDIDDTLRTLIRRDALNGGQVEVVFDAPTKDWASRRNSPTLDVYLYDIREDVKRRTHGVVDVRDPTTGRVMVRKVPPRHYKLSYLVTAWTQRPEDEHRLLSAVLGCFIRWDVLPMDDLAGSLGRLQMPVGVTVAIPPPEDRSWSDVWSALGGELKPSLDLVITAPFDTHRDDTDIAPPVLEEPRITVTAPEGPAEAANGGRPGGRARPGNRRAMAAIADHPVVEDTLAGGKPERRGRVVRARNTSEQ